MTMMPVNINGENFKFSVGKHNELQKPLSRNSHRDLHQILSVCTLAIQ